MSILRPDLMMKCVIPVVMAGIIAVSGRDRMLNAGERAYIILLCRSTDWSCLCSSLVAVSGTPLDIRRGVDIYVLFQYKASCPCTLASFSSVLVLVSVSLVSLPASLLESSVMLV